MIVLIYAVLIAIPSVKIALSPIIEGERSHRIISFFLFLASLFMLIGLMNTSLEAFISKHVNHDWTLQEWSEYLNVIKILLITATTLNFLSLVKGRPLFEIKSQKRYRIV